MLAGYLPFDDDPANPEGDNINLLYKYICTTPLTFPEYVSAMARDLLRQILSTSTSYLANLEPTPAERITLKAVKAHTWLYPHRSLFRTPINDFEAQARESISHLSATAMGRSVSAQEPQHTSYIPASSSHLSHPTKAVSPHSSPEIPSITLDPRRHTVQLEYDRPAQRAPEETSKRDKRVLLEIPGSKPQDYDVSGLGVPPAPALARSATTGATATRPTPLDTVEERSPERGRQEKREEKSTSGVTRPPTSRPTMPHGAKPRPTSYHPPSTAGVPMSKGRSVSGDRTANLILQHRSSSGSAGSRKGYIEVSPTAPISSYQNVSGEILQSTTPPQETLNLRTRAASNATLPSVIEQPVGPPPPQRSKTHKRASASISMVADKVFGFFTTTKGPSPHSSPQRPTENLSRQTTTTRRVSVIGSGPGSTVLSKKKEKTNTPSKTSITRSTTENTLSNSPKSTRTENLVKSPTQTFISERQSPPRIPKSRTDGHIAAPELLPPLRRPSESPKMNKAARKLGELGPEKGSTGAARRVMEFFRRRARVMGD